MTVRDGNRHHFKKNNGRMVMARKISGRRGNKNFSLISQTFGIHEPKRRTLVLWKIILIIRSEGILNNGSKLDASQDMNRSWVDEVNAKSKRWISFFVDFAVQLPATR